MLASYPVIHAKSTQIDKSMHANSLNITQKYIITNNSQKI